MNGEIRYSIPHVQWHYITSFASMAQKPDRPRITFCAYNFFRFFIDPKSIFRHLRTRTTEKGSFQKQYIDFLQPKGFELATEFKILSVFLFSFKKI